MMMMIISYLFENMGLNGLGSILPSEELMIFIGKISIHRARQLGIHGANHNQPWRLVTTSRCSWSRDDEPWQDRPGGDRRH